MASQVDRRFNALKLAAAAGTPAGQIHGEVDPYDLERLDDLVAEPGGRVRWSIQGSTDKLGRPAIGVSIEGLVPLTCQRCLGSLAQPVAQSTILLLARTPAELPSLDEASEHEVVLADAPLDPLQVVEDELLLTLPFAPRHEQDCSPAQAST